MRLPFISRKRYEKEVNSLRNTINFQSESHYKEIQSLKNTLLKLIPKLRRFQVTRNYDGDGYPRFRVMYELDSQFVIDCLAWGDDQGNIKLLCEMMGRELERELRTINFVRFKEITKNWGEK